MPARSLVLAVLAALALVAHAGDDWKHTGSAIRKKKVGFLSVDVYEIQHHMKDVPAKKSKDAAIDAETDKKFVLTMLRNMPKEKMQKALEEAFEANGCKDAEKIK